MQLIKKSVKKDLIFGPTKERDGTWRIKTNYELDKLIRHKTIINHIKAQRLNWFGHLLWMPEEQMGRWHKKWHEENENKELD